MIRVRGPSSPYDPTYHLFTGFRKIRGIVGMERPDVLEIHSPYLAAWGALRAAPGTYGIRTFQWHSDFIDTYAGVLKASGRGGVGAKAVIAASPSLWSLVRGIAKRCDATLVASKWQADKLTGRGVPNVRHLPFGIEHGVFRPEARSVEGRRELLAMAGRDGRDECAVLVGLGRFAIEKRWDVVLDAFLRVRARRDAVLVLFGAGPEIERMKARVKGSPDIVFPGFTKGRDALARALASADALVHGCPFETFGLSIAEAMGCGLPPVVPDEGGAAEMHVDGAGETYRSLDVVACAAAVERMLDRLANDPDGPRARAVAAARRLPSVRAQFEGQVALYTELLEKRGNPLD